MTNDIQVRDQMTAIWKKAVSLYRGGNYDHSRWFDTREREFLAGIGTQPHEIYDFAEDYCDDGVPSLETFLRIHEIRRDYFLKQQGGVLSRHEVPAEALPARQAELGGFAWLPRLIAKAQAKLRGELHHSIMFGCGGDRAFLREHGLRAEDFFQAVRDHENDDDAILDWLAKHRKPSS